MNNYSLEMSSEKETGCSYQPEYERGNKGYMEARKGVFSAANHFNHESYEASDLRYCSTSPRVKVEYILFRPIKDGFGHTKECILST